MRRAKAIAVPVSLSPAISSQFMSVHCSRKSQKSVTLSPYFGSSGSFRIINVDMTKKLVTSACCDKQHAHCDLQPFYERLANNGKIMTFAGVPLFNALVRRFL